MTNKNYMSLIQSNGLEVEDVVGNIDSFVCVPPIPTGMELINEELRKKLEENIIHAEDEYGEEECLIKIDDVPALPKSDLVCVKAKQKNGKSSALAVLTAVLICGQWFRVKRVPNIIPSVLYIDTEMKERDTWLLQKKVLSLAKRDTRFSVDNIRFINLRKLLHDECKEIIPKYIEEYRPDIVIIDGVVDLLTDFNDVVQSQTLVRSLMSWAELYDCCIVTVIHTNKATEDNNMRGHLGTILSQKSAMTFACEKDKKTNIITVKCDDCRHAPVPNWSFGFDENGIPVCKDDEVAEREAKREADNKEKREKANAEKYKKRRSVVLGILRQEGTSGISRNELTKRLETILKMSHSTISPLITKLINDRDILPGGYNGNLIVNETSAE